MMLNKTHSTFIVDAFTNKAFSGNPAAVCILKESKSDAWMQQVAAEFNLSETAFLQQQENNRWHLRWFTPTCEVKLCGHATLASAHVLLNELQLPYPTLIFSSLSGDLHATAKNSHIQLDFPRIAYAVITHLNAGIQALNMKPVCAYHAGEDIILELTSEDEVLQYNPDFSALAQINARGVIITAKSKHPERDFVSRFFAPNSGINEDPVTGSAHCSLGGLWSDKLNKKILRAEQLSARRGLLDLIIHDTRVELIGECVTVMKGELAI
jgi:PhzF family phenazine biosynthesis protein